VYGFCHRAGIRILAEIPFDRRIASAYANGRIVATAEADRYGRLFAGLAADIRTLAAVRDPEVDHA
jgi:MinD superfamily P-loop ATPase